MLSLILTIAVVGCSSSGGEEAANAGPTAYANVDLANTRSSPSSLRAATISGLQLAWSRPMQARAEGLHYIGSPVVKDGVVYIQDPESNVEAIDLSNGKLLWRTEYAAPAGGSFGITVGDGMVFGGTPTTAFALNAETGDEVWSIELSDGTSEILTMTPGYHEGVAYFTTSPAQGEGGEVGVLRALDSETGEEIWHFNNVPRSLWGHPEVNYGGGIFYAPAFDGEGSMYVGISHAGPIPGTAKYPWGTSRPGRNLYSNSIVKLNEKTGKVEWYYQINPHGLCNGFLVSPILAKAGGHKVVMDVGVLGVLAAVDQRTGNLLWRTPLGVHNGHDNDGLLAMRGELASLKTPMDVYPGTFGGVAAPMSVRGSTVFVPVVNGGTRLLSQTNTESLGTPRGELVAVDIGTGAIKWKRRFPSSLYGPTTTTNDLVFSTTFDGRLFALDADSGKEAWEEDLPVIVEGGMAISGDMLLARAGSAATETPKLLAYRLAG
ncbi:MAG TPA: PQQ-binding-like beta-propeller repeat protein [Solirubrobacterales bacterium]|nr:PQQ-binding-like beta-propeller repeat protein [Solirubrobacterales bacterium]